MRKVAITILKRAEQDMEDIYHYIADELQSPQSAMDQFEAIAKAIQILGISLKDM